MSIILWIFQALFAALWMVYWKKVVENKKIWNNWQTFFSRTNHWIIILIMIIFWVFWFEYNIPTNELTTFNILIFILAVFWLYTTYPLRRVAYANEKMSVLQPFAMLFQVFPIIIWFIFIATERANLITFLMAILASIVVIWTSIDFKKFEINKYSLMVLTSSIIKSIQIFAVIYFLTILSPETLYLTESILIIIISSLLILFKWEFKEIKLLTKSYFKLLTSANIIAIVSILLVLNMYTSLWIVATSLISLLYLWFVYLFWYLILKEIPSKKDILVTIFVAFCIIIWILFKV